MTRTLRRQGLRFAGYATSVIVVLALWQHLSSRAVIPLLFPSPLSTFEIGLQLARTGQLMVDLQASVVRILAGFVLGSILGVTLGVFMGSFRTVRLLFEPYVQFLRFLPALAWIPPVMLWVGTGEDAKILLLAYTTVFIVTLNTMIGVSTVPRDQLRGARSFGATSWQLFYMVKAPATVPYMVTGMRIAMGNCFMTVVAAELVAADAGLGYLIFSSRQWMQTELAFVGITMIGLLGLLADRIFHVSSTRLLWRYHGGQTSKAA
jgi:NitT/TauT family transport system permease protein